MHAQHLDPESVHTTRRPTGRLAFRLACRLAFSRLALLSGIAGALAGCGVSTADAPAADTRAVSVASVASATLSETVRAVGLLAPKDEARLSFKLGGVIDSIGVEEGTAVHRGQVLAVLKLAEISANVEQARQSAAKATRDLARAKSLYADGVATQEQVEDLGTVSIVANAALRTAEFNARYARIEAPADGIVLRKLAEAHELVQAGQPVLVVAGFGRGWIVKTALADRDIVGIARDDAVRITFDAYPAQSFAGRVSNISSAADGATGTFPVEIQVAEGNARFVQGLVAKVTLEPRRPQQSAAIVVPFQALLEADGDKAFVFVFDPATRTVKHLAIRTGRMAGGSVEIIDGLRAGEQVVTDGAAFLADGETVRIADPRLASR